MDAVLCASFSRELSASAGPLYMWADSSLQHGADWFLSTLLVIEAEVVIETMDAAHMLMRSVDAFHHVSANDDHHSCADIALQRNAAGQALRKSVRIHKQLQIPLGSGIGQSTVVHFIIRTQQNNSSGPIFKGCDS